jgi:hypothetical protein
MKSCGKNMTLVTFDRIIYHVLTDESTQLG